MAHKNPSALLKDQFSEVHLISLSDRKPGSTIADQCGGNNVVRIQIRAIKLRGTLSAQVNWYTDDKSYTKNYELIQFFSFLEQLLAAFNQCFVRTKNEEWTIHKGILSTKKLSAEKEQNLAHNTVKKQLLALDVPYDFLIELGVQTKEGKVRTDYAKKMKQVNHLLQEIIPHLPKDEDLVILDCGCGKGYLSFALHYYLHEVEKRQVILYGVDRKKEVISSLQSIVDKLSIHGLHFVEGDILSYQCPQKPTVVIALHACDTATDDALYYAIQTEAKAVFVAPCCHHEMASKLNVKEVFPFFKHNIFKERFCELYTDAIRAALLEKEGYRVDVLEFVASEHTPRNVLLRAVKTNRKRDLSPVATPFPDVSKLSQLLCKCSKPFTTHSSDS